MEGAQRNCHGNLTPSIAKPLIQLAVHCSPRLLSVMSAMLAKLRGALMPERQESSAKQSYGNLALPSG